MSVAKNVIRSLNSAIDLFIEPRAYSIYFKLALRYSSRVLFTLLIVPGMMSFSMRLVMRWIYSISLRIRLFMASWDTCS